MQRGRTRNARFDDAAQRFILTHPSPQLREIVDCSTSTPSETPLKLIQFLSLIIIEISLRTHRNTLEF